MKWILPLLYFFPLFASEEKKPPETRVFEILALLFEQKSSSIEPIGGGLTNTNYKVHVGDESYFVRCGDEQTALLGVSLGHEWKCISMAHEAGFAPKPMFYHPEEKVFITHFVDT